MAASLRVEHVDSSRWEDLAGLFGRGGASNGCWCQYWLLGPAYHRRERSLNRDDLHAQAGSGEAGLLAYDAGDRAVGWARLTPRAGLPWLSERFDLDESPAWAMPCFYVASSSRGTGVMSALIDAGVQWASARGVTLQACPVDPAVPGATRNRFSGVLQPFLDAGFREVARPRPERVIVERVTSS